VYYIVPSAPCTVISLDGFIEYLKTPRGETTYAKVIEQFQSNGRPPALNLRSWNQDQWKYDQVMTNKYLRCLQSATSTAISFSGKRVLVTGCGQGSVGAEIVKGLSIGGAQVIQFPRLRPFSSKCIVIMKPGAPV
jgi:fatty acid synthase subunit alpha